MNKKPKLKIGILDFGYRKHKTPGMNVLSDVFEYASLVEDTGFSSYWLSEHHNSGHAWSTPEMLLPLLAGHTNKINIGLTGVLLASHSPYRVALNFKLLEGMFPGRIDLGLANAAVELRIAKMLLSDPSIDESYVYQFARKTEELLSYLKGDIEVFNRDQLIIPPSGGGLPRVWRLSTSFNALEDCLDRKMHICKSTFHPGNNKDVAPRDLIIDFKRKYMERHGSMPHVRIAVSGICEKDDKLAKTTASRLNLKHLSGYDNFIIGSSAYFKEKLLEMYEDSAVDEFIFYDQALDPKKRIKTLELMSTEFNLQN